MNKKSAEMLRKHHINYRMERFGDLIGRIIEHSKIARKDGVLALEKQVVEDKNYLYRKLMNLVIDDNAPEVIQRAAGIYIENIQNYLESHQKSVKFTAGEIETMIRQMKMIAEAVHMIQTEYSPYMIEEILFLYVIGEPKPASRFKRGSPLD